MSDESLWPARNVAEYAYCPRLFYYMQVEGVFLPSADTEKGHVVHRRVDRASATPGEAAESSSDPQRPKVVRSLSLTSHSLGLTATLDLAEIEGQTAVPVEYRKGKPKRVTITGDHQPADEAEAPPLSSVVAWPTDRVQVGLQAILLQEAGYTVTEAVLYYAEEKLRLTVPVDEALVAEALTALFFAIQSGCGIEKSGCRGTTAFTSSPNGTA